MKPWSVHVGFVEDSVALGQVFFEYIALCCHCRFTAAVYSSLFSSSSSKQLLTGRTIEAWGELPTNVMVFRKRGTPTKKSTVLLSVFRTLKSEILLSFPCYERHSLLKRIKLLLFWTLSCNQYSIFSFRLVILQDECVQSSLKKHHRKYKEKLLFLLSNLNLQGKGWGSISTVWNEYVLLVFILIRHFAVIKCAYQRKNRLCYPVDTECFFLEVIADFILTSTSVIRLHGLLLRH